MGGRCPRFSLSLSHSVLVIPILSLSPYSVLVMPLWHQWQMPMKGLARCLTPHLFEELELAQRRMILPGLGLTADLDSVTQKGI